MIVNLNKLMILQDFTPTDREIYSKPNALMATAAINVEFFDLLLTFLYSIFLYSILGVLILRTVKGYRSTEISEKELEDIEEEEEDDHDEEHLIIPPRDSNLNFSAGEEDHTDGGDEEEEEDEADEEEHEEGDALTLLEIREPSVSNSSFHGRLINSGAGSCEPEPGNQENGGEDGRREELDSGEIDGLFCSICFEAWTGSGGHQLCCIPCGHVYGLSCIKRWLRSSKKCPQCNGYCTLMDVRRLYATRLCVADEELQKIVQSIEETESANLEPKAVPLTVEELIDQLRSNPKLVEKIETALAELHEHQVFTP